MIKKLFRFLKWYFIYFVSRGASAKVVYVDPASIKFGQRPESQFSAKSTYRFHRDGDWDLRLLPIEEHTLYKSYVKHFVEGAKWEDTPIYHEALKGIKDGKSFRGAYSDVGSLKERFSQCDELYKKIDIDGFKSNRELYDLGVINNRLYLLDEVTINISREGSYILNDGWHRFLSAKLLGIKNIPVRVLVQYGAK